MGKVIDLAKQRKRRAPESELEMLIRGIDQLGDDFGAMIDGVDHRIRRHAGQDEPHLSEIEERRARKREERTDRTLRQFHEEMDDLVEYLVERYGIEAPSWYRKT